MKINDAIRHALNGDAVLFLGSGFSIGAKNHANEEFSPGFKLAKEICRELEIEEQLDLDLASGIYIEKIGTDKLIEKLQKKYTAYDVSEDHIICAKIPWKRVYTTNYDNVFELAASKDKTKYISANLNTNIKDHLDKNRICLHINGYIDELNRDSINQSFKLTTKSYLTDSFSRSKWSSVFRQDINIAKAVIFIGYSMYDLDIARIVGSIEDISSKTLIVTGENPSIGEKHTINQIGKIVPIGLIGFCKKCNEIKKDHDPVKKELTLRSFTEYTIKDTNIPPEDKNRYDLFLRGDLDRNLLFKSLYASERKYIANRKIAKNFFEKNNEGYKNFLIHGSLGNGKTVLTEQICCGAIRAGWRVFILGDFNKHSISDFIDICKIDEKILIVVENYSRHLELIKQMLMRAFDKITYLFTERTSIHDYYNDELINFSGEESLIEFDCNKLNEQETDEIIALLDETALWKKTDERNSLQKKKYIQSNLKNEFQGILLDILKSPEIKNRLASSLEGLNQDSDMYKIIVLSLILKAINYIADMYIISELLEIPNPAKIISGRKNTLSEIFTYRNGRLEVKSSILSNFLLTNIIPGSAIADILTLTYRRCDELRDLESIFPSIQRDLRRYSVVQSLLPEEQRRSLLLNYYEEIKNLKSSKGNPFFWVQYGIARLAYRDFEIASNCFSRAYSIGETSENFNEYQIDNHYARLLLERSIYDHETISPINLFKEAHTLLVKQVKNASQNKHYPYRVASLYSEFYSLHKETLNNDDLSYVHSAANTILNTAKNAPHILSQNIYVRKCIDSLSSIIA